jgi:hypothetical protein
MISPAQIRSAEALREAFAALHSAADGDIIASPADADLLGDDHYADLRDMARELDFDLGLNEDGAIVVSRKEEEE